jgi:hypothetical protein
MMKWFIETKVRTSKIVLLMPEPHVVYALVGKAPEIIIHLLSWFT